MWYAAQIVKPVGENVCFVILGFLNKADLPRLDPELSANVNMLTCGQCQKLDVFNVYHVHSVS